jgi:hypothetical protein
MYLRKKHLSRRTLLQGAGVAVGLPLLDAMVPAATALAQTAAAPKLRAGFFYIPHGAVMHNTAHGAAEDHWTPSGQGSSFQLSRIMASLEPFKDKVTSFGELINAASDGSVHTINPATWLSGVRPDQAAAGASMSTTVDQLVAMQIGQETALPSLELASETTIQVAACTSGACYYSSTLSFRNANSPLPMEYNPRKVFIQLFGEGDTQAEREALIAQNKSLLDLIAERTQALQLDLGASDRRALSDYLENVREIERRVAIAASQDFSDLEIPTAPVGELDSFDAQVRLMFDLIHLSYQADLTRVASYIMVAEGTNRTYDFIGVPDAFHPVSHHANDLERIRRVARIQTYHMERFADFMGKLAATPDGDGTLLDHAMLMYGSNMSNSDRHNNYPLPLIVAGGAAGRLTHNGGQHIVLPERTPITNVHLSMLNKAGVELASFGDSTGMVAGV